MRSTRISVTAVFASLLVAPFLWWAPAEAATPTLSVDDVEWFEESPLGPFFYLTVRLSAPTDHAVSVSYHTADGTAQGGWRDDPESDYARTGGDVTIPAGETAASSLRELWITDDDRVEGDEHFFVRLYDPVGATIADGTGRVVINNASSDRDPPPAFVQSNGVLEADTDTTVSVLVKLGARSVTEQTVTVRTLVPRERAATPGEDYEATVAVLTFPPGTLGRRFDIPILGDQLDETDEVILAEVVDGFSTTSPDESRAEVHIVDDDSPSSK